jgi:hypothetical protein
VRKPRSSEHNRHIPVIAYCMTNGDHVLLESGLEHDLLRRLDREPAVVRIISQPFKLSWRGRGPNEHTPDLLTLCSDGSVSVWDARSPEDQDERFLRAATITREACSAVGWRHEVFSGLGRVERLNLLWLHGFRRTPGQLSTFSRPVMAAAEQPGTQLGDLLSLDAGTGELTGGSAASAVPSPSCPR